VIAELITPVVVLCLLTLLLALLMVIAESFISNYGECTITVNQEKNISVRGGSSLLSSLAQADIFIPSACGGRGSCGLCKLTIREPEPTHLPTELPWLDPDERGNGVYLSCQQKVKQDMRIDIPQELLAIQRFRARVERLADLTPDIKEVVLTLEEPAEITFTAGQFIQFEVPEYAGSEEPVYRAYSIASAPAQKQRISLHVKYVPEGICTTYIHRFLKSGDPVTFNGPYGDFTLSANTRDAYFVAIGSGMAPVASILLDMADTGVQRKATYFFGARHRCGLFLMDEMRALEHRLPDFRFVPTLSRPKPEDRWTGHVGRVTQLLESYVDDACDKEFYFCGNPHMIDACLAILRRRGVAEDCIFFDKFA